MALLALIRTPGPWWLVVVLLLGGALAGLFAADRSTGPSSHDRARPWRRRLIAAGVRAAAIAAAAAIAYPTLFGIQVAPPVSALMRAAPTAQQYLSCAVFAAGAVLTTLAATPGWRTIADSAQGLAATAAVFLAFAQDLGATSADAWPDPEAALPVLLMLWLSWRLRVGIASYCDGTRQRGVHVLHQGLSLLLQAPVMLMYGFVLGRQVAIH